MPMPTDSALIGLAIATLGGAAVGFEREWSGHAAGERARFAGIRTFTLLGALGGLSGWLWQAGLAGPAMVLLAGAVGLVVAAYAAASRRDIDGTTEVAALIVLAAGMLAVVGSYRLASGVIAIETLLLLEKTRLHAAVRKIEDVGLRSAIRFGVMALVVLPLLPVGPYGPLGGIRPRELWALVLFFSGLSFLGYAARRAMGSRVGYLVSGLLGGVVSSTNTTFTFARLSHREPGNAASLAFGALAANAVLYPRVLIATAVLQRPLLDALWPYLVWPLLVTAVIAAIGWWRTDVTDGDEQPLRNPLQLLVALRLAVLFQVVMMAVSAAGGFWGDSGVLTSAAVLGLTDVDAVTISMARNVGAVMSLEVAAAAIATGVLANTLLKSGIALTLGGARFRLLTGGTLIVVTLVTGAVLFLRYNP